LRAGTRPQGPAADGSNPPRGRWKEPAMLFLVLIVIIAALMIVVVPRIRRKR
jgi:hypothetical protein